MVLSVIGRPILWHFTCADHGHAALGGSGLLRPYPHLLIPRLGPVVWLTDDPAPQRDAVGLTSEFITCDRLAYRYRVDPTSECLPWPALRHLASPTALRDLESFGKPETWWISRAPIRAVLDMPQKAVA